MLILCGGAFAAAMSAYLLMFSIPLFLTERFQAGPFALGTAGFANNAAYTLAVLFFARHHLSRRFPYFIYAAAGIGLTVLAIPLVPFAAVFAALVLNGLSYSLFWPPLQAYIRSFPGPRGAGYFNMAWSAGVIAGAASAGLLYTANPALPFGVAGLSGLLVSAVYLGRKRAILATYNGKAEEPAATGEVFGPAYTNETRFLVFLAFCALGAVISLFPRLAFDRGFSPRFIAGLMSTLVIARFLTFTHLRNAPLFRPGALAAMLGALAGAACVVIGMGSTGWMLIPGLVLLGTLSTIAYHNSFLLHLRSGLPMELHEGLIGAGLFTGPLLAGTLGQWLSLPWAFVVLGVLFLLAGVTCTACRNRT